MDMYKSIVQSCDTYYYMLANDMGIDLIAAQMAQFGFGSRTGIDIEGESSGVLPSPEWKKRRFKARAAEVVRRRDDLHRHRPGLQRLHHPAGPRHGHGGGGRVMFRPHLVKYIESASDGERRMIEPSRSRPYRSVRTTSTPSAVRWSGVNREGTGTRAFAGAPLSGGRQDRHGPGVLPEGRQVQRTGSPSVCATTPFIAFAPADKPTIALAVLVENGGFGAESPPRSPVRCSITTARQAAGRHRAGIPGRRGNDGRQRR